jgi:ketosteroid isomerase-like protein
MKEFKLNDFFEATDSMNSQQFSDFFHDDASWFFGNSDPLVGSNAIKQMTDDFFETLKSIKHNVEKNLRSGDTVFLEGKVSYFRHDESVIELPFACSIDLLDEKIRTYKTYIDLAPLLAFETRI